MDVGFPAALRKAGQLGREALEVVAFFDQTTRLFWLRFRIVLRSLSLKIFKTGKINIVDHIIPKREKTNRLHTFYGSLSPLNIDAMRHHICKKNKINYARGQQ